MVRSSCHVVVILYTFDCQLKAMCFAQMTSDPCLYISTGEMFVIAVYVDIVLAGKNDRKLSKVKKALASKFDVKYLDKLHYFLGVSYMTHKIQSLSVHA